MKIDIPKSTIPLRDMFVYRNVDLMGVHAFETITAKALNKMCNVQDDDIVIVKMKKNNELVMGKVRHQTSTDHYEFDCKNHIVGIVDKEILQKIELQEREVDLLCSIDAQWDAIKASDRGKWHTGREAVKELETFVNTIKEYQTLLVRKEQQVDLAQKKRDAEMAIRMTKWHRFADKRPDRCCIIFVYYQHGEDASGYYQYNPPMDKSSGYGMIFTQKGKKPWIIFTSDDIKREGSVLWWCEAPGK